jgi:hypothetical protein
MSSGLQLKTLAPALVADKFERTFESEAVVNHPDYLWDRPPFVAAEPSPPRSSNIWRMEKP